MTQAGPPRYKLHSFVFKEEDGEWTVTCSCGSFEEKHFSSRYGAALAASEHKAKREAAFH